jgi:extracellular factor (EF) 3-hydroxypalmitic acid methyl ester biosynthesis protein
MKTAPRDFERGYQFLDAAHAGLNEGRAGAVLELAHQLRGYRPELGAQWPEFARTHCRHHSIREKLHESPLSRRCFEQPRGYPGDPVTLDYIYGYNSMEGVSELGRAIYERERVQTGCRSVRARRDLLAAKVDETALRVHRPRVLAIACGHLREAQKSEAVAAGRVGDFVALDQDPESLAVVEREQPQVQPIRATIRSLLNRKTAFDQDFDFIYAAGLYDYLPDAVAACLTSILFGMLRSNGHLLLGNFHPDYPDAASMEAILTWWLIYRDEHQMQALMSQVDSAQIHGWSTFRDDHRNLVFLEMVRE